MLTEAGKVKFTARKLTKQSSRYGTKVETLGASWAYQPIKTWLAMKNEPQERYVPLIYYAPLLN